MTIRNLEFAARPKSLAIFGASSREGAVGRVVIENIVKGGFGGSVWPVNPKYAEMLGLTCYSSSADLPSAPDLAIIATPPDTVAGIIRELGAKGCRAAVVITAGLTRDNGLRQAMLDAARPHLFRIIGPNTVGLMIPPLGINASFAHMAAKPGNIALLSQSGAIATSLVDWAAVNNVGFSYVVSLGDMADVDVGDWLDLLAGDRATRAIVMYLESIPEPRKFMSAARAAARIKPVIVIKAGRHEQAARAAATHTGALSGADNVVDAVLHRAGILRVDGLVELFDAAEITARFAPLERSRVGIVTNGGGAGVLALDRLIDCEGEVATLGDTTLAELDRTLPRGWSRANPVDIIGDAPPERYRGAVAAVAADPSVDVLMVLNCPTGLASPAAAAKAVAELSDKGLIAGKPVISCWLGAHTAQEGRAILHDAGMASVDTPAEAAHAAAFLSDWSKAQKALGRVPSSRSEDVPVDRPAALAVIKAVAAEGRRMLTEVEAKAVIRAYGIDVPETVTAATPQAVRDAADKMLSGGRKVVVKLLAKAISHKSDVGGVVLAIESAAAAALAAQTIQERVRRLRPDAAIEGFVVQPMVLRERALELIAGISLDPIFGPVVLFGAGGIAVEVVNDTAVALPPMDNVLAGDLIDRTRIGRLLAGFRDRKPANRAAIIAALNGLSQLVIDFPCVVGVDVNPLLADDTGVIALDARIEIAPERVGEPGPNPALIVRPYPVEWTKHIIADDAEYVIRPIKPADFVLYPAFLSRISPEDIRLRFLAPRGKFPDEMLKRLTQLDYARDMAFVALEKKGDLAAVGRLSCDPDRTIAEFALLVRSDLQGHGLGWALLQHIVEFGRSERIRRIEGIILEENEKMLVMCRAFGFRLERHAQEPGLAHAVLDL